MTDGTGRTRRTLAAGLCLLLLPTWALTAYLITLGQAYLPSGDLLYGGMEVFLTDAGSGQWPWAFLWRAHNEAHFIPWPKAIFLLDMAFSGGQGLITAAAATLAAAATALLLARHINGLDSLDLGERHLFAVLALLLLGSPIIGESLINPINSQWAWLAFGTVLTGSGLHALQAAQRMRGIALLGTGLPITLASGGPLPVVLAAMALTLLLAWPGLRVWRARAGIMLAGLILALLAWELCNGWLLNYRHPPLLVLLYQTLHPDPSYNDWQDLHDSITEDAAFSHLGWLLGWLGYLAKFSLPPLHRMLPTAALVLFLLAGLIALWRNRSRMQARHLFFIYLASFALLLGLSAAVFRAFYPVYSFRQANLGFLLLMAAWVLVLDCSRPGFGRRLCVWLVLPYSLLFAVIVARETGPAATMTPNLIRPAQIALTLDLREPQWPYRGWRHDDERDAAMLARFREHRLGAFRAPEYRYFQAMDTPPVKQIPCTHRLLALQPHPSDPRAFYVIGESRDARGRTLARVLIEQPDGQAIGYGSRRLPDDSLWTQLRQPWPWGAWLRTAEGAPDPLHITVFDAQRRCQPWRLSLPDAVPDAAPAF